MPRLLHTADVHLGARHDDLGPRAAAQRERQFAAFARSIELAIDEPVDLFLVCGDLFDSNSQPKRSVERAAAELGRLVERRIPTVIIPGTHDCYDAGSVYRVFDLAALAGANPAADPPLVSLLTPDHPSVSLPQLDLTVHARVFASKRAPASPLAGFSVSAASPTDARLATSWHVGMCHGALKVPGRIEQDEVIFSAEEIAASGLDYLALGHWHSYREGVAGGTVWAYAGAPEPVSIDQDGAGQVLIVNLAASGAGRRSVTVEPRAVGRTRVERLDLDAAELESQAALAAVLRRRAHPDLVLDVRLVGLRPDELDLVTEEVE
ncbi:MAG TPA: DNA repair exonuclease, partial [Candidatus Limnocylindria bacterium]|nr:DNA repair exonuclease [Candidatus Limnocylindria bacterium]